MHKAFIGNCGACTICRAPDSLNCIRAVAASLLSPASGPPHIPEVHQPAS